MGEMNDEEGNNSLYGEIAHERNLLVTICGNVRQVSDKNVDTHLLIFNPWL